MDSVTYFEQAYGRKLQTMLRTCHNLACFVCNLLINMVLVKG